MTKENFIKKTIESLEEYLHHEMWRYTEPPLGREECELFLELLREVGKVEKRPTGKWIPVSERLPEEHDSLFKNEFFDRTSDIVVVTVADRKGQKTTTYAHTIDGKWSCDLLKACSDYKITAWQPLPEPYK